MWKSSWAKESRFAQNQSLIEFRNIPDGHSDKVQNYGTRNYWQENRMSRVYSVDGSAVPVTVLEVGPNRITR